MSSFSESTVEQAALDFLESLGYSILSGPDIAPGEALSERNSFDQIVLESRLRQALILLNPDIPCEALDDAFRKITRLDLSSLVANNHSFHQMLVNGVPVEYQRPDGSIAGVPAQIIDFENPENNEWLAVNQFTVIENRHNRRPDVVIFVNGLPLAVIELKNPADENATIWTAFNQLQTYKREIPSLFHYNEALIISDGVEARIGSLTSNKERFMPWRTIEGEELAPAHVPQLQVVLEGVFEKRRFLDLIRFFIVFETSDKGEKIKKMAGYHQYHAVNKAITETVHATRVEGDRRVGVVWHTQGSGKSLTMAFYAGRVVLHPVMANPTLVVITDRNDLDNQLFGTFARCRQKKRKDRLDGTGKCPRANAGDRKADLEEIRLPAG